MDGTGTGGDDAVLPRSAVKRDMPLPNRAQMDALEGGSGDVTSDPGDMDVSAHDVSLMSKSQLRAGLTQRLSEKSSHDT